LVNYMSKAELEEVLWVEKYRPKTLDEIVDQEEVVQALKKFVESKNIPNMLFAGPPGTGKTTAALALAHDLYGENWRNFVLELNASDERGIEMVRTKLKDFARSRVTGEIPYKILILDEADMMTREAQHALRRTMENYADITRFILICNYPSRIIEPIQSRTAVFKFKRLPKEAIVSRLKFIAEQENVDLRDDGLEAIIEISEGDLRKAINLLQSVAYLGVPVTKEVVYRTAGLVYPEKVEEMIKLAFDGKFESARKELIRALVEEGVSGEDLLAEFFRAINRGVINVDPEDKIGLLRFLSDLDFRISQGATDYLQLTALLAYIADLGMKYKKKA